MIFDKLENLHLYDSKYIFIEDFINTVKFEKGKIPIECHSFAIGLEYDTKSSQEGLWEAHRENLDIHCVIEGEEIVEITDISSAKATTDYVQDYQLFTANGTHFIKLVPNTFLVLFPHEVHKTGCVSEKVNTIKKFVVKLKI